jgi:hypothetical protein
MAWEKAGDTSKTIGYRPQVTAERKAKRNSTTEAQRSGATTKTNITTETRRKPFRKKGKGNGKSKDHGGQEGEIQQRIKSDENLREKTRFQTAL